MAMKTVLITGANRGVGLALTALFAGQGDRVTAMCRARAAADDLGRVAGNISIESMDVADHVSIDALADRLAGEEIDIVINNAGIYGGNRKTFAEFDYDARADAFRVNTMGPFKVTQAFAANLAAAEHRVLGSITSQMGSIALSGAGYYAYRSNKAALNMVGRNLAADLSRQRVIVILVHPGWVRTDMGGRSAPLTPDASARAVAAIYERARSADSGRFFNYTGESQPW